MDACTHQPLSTPLAGAKNGSAGRVAKGDLINAETYTGCFDVAMRFKGPPPTPTTTWWTNYVFWTDYVFWMTIHGFDALAGTLKDVCSTHGCVHSPTSIDPSCKSKKWECRKSGERGSHQRRNIYIYKHSVDVIYTHCMYTQYIYI